VKLDAALVGEKTSPVVDLLSIEWSKEGEGSVYGKTLRFGNIVRPESLKPVGLLLRERLGRFNHGF
jgi:hypothetical protein